MGLFPGLEIAGQFRALVPNSSSSQLNLEKKWGRCLRIALSELKYDVPYLELSFIIMMIIYFNFLKIQCTKRPGLVGLSLGHTPASDPSLPLS